jgi:hypothetical protein
MNIYQRLGENRTEALKPHTGSWGDEANSRVDGRGGGGGGKQDSDQK